MHAAILEAVMSHQLPPGTRLVEMPLCEAFGVNRSLLRRVLVRLASEKVIELHHNRGALIAQASPRETREVFEARRLIETALLQAHAAPEPRMQQALAALVDEEERAHREGERSRLIRLSGEFHLRLVGAFGNRELVSLLRGLVARTSLMIALYETPGHGVCSFDEHREILDAIRAGDMAAAARLMGHHLEHCEMKLRERSARPEIDFLRLFGAARGPKPGRRPARAAAPAPKRAPASSRKKP
ncbi:GntR family transcriptional regulator [Burkholderiaceae bacterium FT117]|uniref:GntR family transcriptional regulator n=1 Tax=Zeimonas sediminis TaxID=2944268 RepID=UPI0023430750|nr:GntR family transcriptional regulator [Zeimonas sediminis]MCM5570592.1 GntR family transcriptional regulator [Zeimonas sediminis]